MQSKRLRLQQFLFVPGSILFAFAIASTGCGSGGMSSTTTTTPPLTGNTSVTVLLSSSGNDQLSQYNIDVSSLTLTSQSGKTVNLVSTITSPTPPRSEFMHLNGPIEPLLTATVPQGIYTAASATAPGGGFACVSQIPGAVQTSYFGPPQSVTITLPTPITITGTAMALSLNLQVSQSATFSNCDLAGASYTNTPTFNLLPVTIASQPTNAANGKQNGIEGLVASVNTTVDGFSMVTTDGTKLSVNVGGGTVYQGVSGLSAIAAGMSIEMDTAIQSDGSLLATRVGVEDTDPTTVSVLSGPVLAVYASGPVISLFGRAQEGYLFQNLIGGAPYYSFNDAVFQTSGQFANLQSLPFVPAFTSATMFPGQNVYVTSHATTAFAAPPVYAPLATVTLVPQTINGTVTATGSDGGFATYTVALASYDLIPNLAIQPGQTTLLTDPSSVVVYVDSNAQTLNSNPLAVGSLLRFNGLLFNDNGTLRMDCGQINDGVKE